MMLDTLISEPEQASAQFRAEERPAETALPLPSAELALWVILATVTMLFAGFTSAYLVRRAAADWVPVLAPPVLWLNTLLLLLSSAGLELSKNAQKARRPGAASRWLLASTALGTLFLCGQVAAWRQLSALGIFLPTSPHGSFLYMLTGVHAVHVLGGLAALLYLLARRKEDHTAARGGANSLALTALYWHFVTGVWIFLYVLLFIWR